MATTSQNGALNFRGSDLALTEVFLGILFSFDVATELFCHVQNLLIIKYNKWSSSIPHEVFTFKRHFDSLITCSAKLFLTPAFHYYSDMIS